MIKKSGFLLIALALVSLISLVFWAIKLPGIPMKTLPKDEAMNE